MRNKYLWVRLFPGRPGCVTAYAFYLWFCALLAIVGVVVAAGVRWDTSEGLLMIGIPCTVAAICVVVGIGLWRLENWARLVVIVVQSVVLTVVTPYAVVTLIRSVREIGVLALAEMGGPLLLLLLNGYVVIWFASSRDRFE